MERERTAGTKSGEHPKRGRRTGRSAVRTTTKSQQGASLPHFSKRCDITQLICIFAVLFCSVYVRVVCVRACVRERARMYMCMCTLRGDRTKSKGAP